MSEVFTSYSRRDTEMVDQVVGEMKESGLSVWIDREEIQAGNQWRVQIVQAIDTCDAFVLMLSPNSAASDNVRKEIDLAQDSGRKIFVLMLEPVKLPAEIRYQLAGLQFINVHMLGFDQAVSQLTCILKEHVASLRPAEQQKTLQAEVVIKGVDFQSFTADMQEQLLNFVAQLAHANRSGLVFAGMAAGSVHVFIDMPAYPAFELKTLALNRDRRFRKFGITSLRLVGDAKFINISLGILTTAATIGFLQTLWLSTPPLLVPVLGATLGKILTISLVVGLTTALALSVPNAIASPPAPLPSCTPTLTSVPVRTPSLRPAATRTRILAATSTAASTLMSSTVVPSATPQNPLVLRDTLCWLGPGPDYEVVNMLQKDTRVELTGRGTIDGWWIIVSPIYHSDCWIMESDLQISPGTNVQDLPFVYPPPKPTHTRGPRPETPIASPVHPACTPNIELNPDCYCAWYPEVMYCICRRDPYAPGC